MNENQMYDHIQDKLTNVVDPEIGINIVDLGLIYGIDISKNGIFLTITLTSVGCPLRELIEEDIRNVLGISQHIIQPVYFNWVFSPPWSAHRMTEEGKAELQSLGGYIPAY